MDFFYKAGGAILAPFKYAEREIKVAKENLEDEAKHAMANLLKMLVIGFLALLFLLFISVSAAMSINEAMDNAWAGFAMVAAFYLLMATGVYVWKKATEKKEHKEYKQHDHKAVAT
jgi:uncharacterized membrane protein YqjE